MRKGAGTKPAIGGTGQVGLITTIMPCEEHVNYQAQNSASVSELYVTLAQTTGIYVKFTDESEFEKL